MSSMTTRPSASPGRPRRRAARVAGIAAGVIALLAVVYTAFALASSDSTGNGQATATSLAATTLSGQQVTVPGGKPSVLFFFSVECGSCGPATQALAQVQQTVGERANFVAVDVAPYETEADVAGFLDDYQATSLAYAIDTDAAWINTYRVSQLSTAIVLDASGTEVFRAVEPSADQIRGELAKLTG